MIWQMITATLLLAASFFVMARKAQVVEEFEYATHPILRPELQLVLGGAESMQSTNSRMVA